MVLKHNTTGSLARTVVEKLKRVMKTISKHLLVFAVSIYGDKCNQCPDSDCKNCDR